MVTLINTLNASTNHDLFLINVVKGNLKLHYNKCHKGHYKKDIVFKEKNDVFSGIK